MLFIKKWFFRKQLTQKILKDLVDKLYAGQSIDIPAELGAKVAELHMQDGIIHTSGTVSASTAIYALKLVAAFRAEHSSELQDLEIKHIIKEESPEQKFLTSENSGIVGMIGSTYAD